MHLNEAQANHLYDLLSALVLSANQAFGILPDEELLAPDGSFDLDACREVLDRVWDDPSLIDELVERNPLGLPPRVLAELTSWKDRICGPQLLLGYDRRGRALFSIGESRVAVMGVMQGIEEVVPEEPPTVVFVTLLPFAGLVVYDTMIRLPPVSYGPGFRSMLEKEVQEAAEYPLVETADDFVALARRVNAQHEEDDWVRFQRQMDRERWERDGTEPMVKGVHRGELAGLSDEVREKRVNERLQETWYGSEERDPASELARRAQKVAPVHTFEDTLATDKKADLERDARGLGISGTSSLRKAQLAERVAQEWIDDPQILRNTLVTCFEAEYATFRGLLAAPDGHMEFAEKDAGQHRFLMPCPPISRLFLYEGTFTALVPEELRAQARSLDFDQVEARRARIERVGHLSEVLTELCGAAAVRDLPTRYEGLFGEKIELDDLVDDLVVLQKRQGSYPTFELWLDRQAEGYDATRDKAAFAYVIHYSLGDAQIGEDMYDGVLAGLEAKGEEITRDGVNEVLDKLERRIEREQTTRDKMLRALIAEHERKAEYGPFPLDPSLATGEAYDWKLRLPEVANLRRWLDAHVPDDEDDFLYADYVIEQLLDVQMGSTRPTEIVEAASELGVFETTEDVEGVLGRIMAMVNALPDWWNNGWSPDALHERSTGRKVFRNPDGTPMKIGRNDLCPCGSGKKYKKCHGR